MGGGIPVFCCGKYASLRGFLRREHPPGIGHEHLQNFILRRGKPHRLPPDKELFCGSIEAYIPHPNLILGLGFPDGAQGIVPAEQGFHPGQQLLLVEGLYQVIVRSRLQTQHPVGALRLGREHQNGHIVVFPNPHGGKQSIAMGHHHIHDNQLGVSGIRQVAGCLPVMGGEHLVARLFQCRFYNMDDGEVIVHHQNSVCICH